ncbi:DUF1054 domain-containing protein [Paenibacillus urinalis]|uniref:UPF0637 protein PUW25_18195 n=1 Tax=Paenibacillus urinalis TaxID=521520 RepID=A0ABY7X5T4_9BACL|nr:MULTISPECIES: DUF1054 domain-containing protein [Paenibacillus]WDH97525.1 DUF1054 domain-containing protein [Paenibacillus urinalis]WDI01192.1 DUF1054 domain-containing protein [Paenibacillus urinalis]GAK39751.1 hypothetical protein TCA2_2240 [Paenibacillus sp. TCA20]
MSQLTYPSLNEADFEVFEVPGLEPRMELLIERVRPKLEVIGAASAPFLRELCGEDMFVHVAKHARRKVNPPNDTWVAIANNKRGYKVYPHFQVGMFGTHAFVIFAIIYESSNKEVFAEALSRQFEEVAQNIPKHFYWSTDHMIPEGTHHEDMTKEDFQRMAERLKNVKKSEVLCGLRIDKNDPILLDGQKFGKTIEETFTALLPLYKMSF